MITPEVLEVYAQGVSTGGLQRWIQDNVVPLVLLGIAVILLWIGGRGDNAGVARRSVGLLVGLVALGIAVSGKGPDVGSFLWTVRVSRADVAAFMLDQLTDDTFLRASPGIAW